MAYATASELLIRFDPDEIAQRADRQLPRLVTDELLRIAATGGDLSMLTPPEQAAVVRAMDKVVRALDDARNTIDSYLSGRYTLPLAPVPQVLTRIACELARFYLYDDQITDPVKLRYEANIKFLRDVAAGVLQLGVDADSGVAPTSGGEAMLVSAGSVWQRQSSKGFL